MLSLRGMAIAEHGLSFFGNLSGKRNMMSRQSGNGIFGWLARNSRGKNKKSGSAAKRRLAFESLEVRRLLAAAAPASIVFQPQTGQGSATLTSANNSSTAKEMQFLVTGVTAGNIVAVYDGSTYLAQATVAAGSTTVTVTTGGTTTVADGQHTFTAAQVDSSNTLGPSSPGIQFQVFAGLGLTQTVATASVGQPFTYTAQTNVPSGDTATIAAGSTLLSGMTFNAATNTFSGWTPAPADAGTTKSFTVNLTDTLGNSSTVTVFVGVAATGVISVVAPPAQVAVGSPVLVSFNDTSGSASTTYNVTTSSTSDPTGSHLTATVMPQTNQVLKIVTDQGDMDFELLNNYTPNTVSHFVNLVNASTYDTGATFYRIIQTFMDQGGVGGSATGTAIPVELNKDLRFTTSGLLAMANDGVDGNSSEFFITNPDDMSNGFLDFRYTIFGKLISGDDVRQAIAATQVGPNNNETSTPFEAPKIVSMSVTTVTTGGVLMLKASSGAQGPYTVTVSDGLGHTQTFQIQAGTDSTSGTAVPITNSFDPPNPWVNPINGDDQILTSYNTPATFTPQTASANGSAVQVSVQAMSGLISTSTNSALAGAEVDNSFFGSGITSYSAVSPDITVAQNGSSYTVTPSAGFYGVQVLEVMGFTPVSGSFQLKVGSTTTAAINFDSTNLAGTAANIQAALRNAGFSGAAVSVASSTTAPDFNFNVTFATAQANIAYVAAATALPVNFTNSASQQAAAQTLTFSATGASWDSTSGVNPVYRAFVPVYVAPPAPALTSISAGGKTITTSTFYNNGAASSELSFNISGVVSGTTVSVYVDGSSTPLVSGSAGSGSTLTLTTDGTTKIADGAHTFTVKQSVATGNVNAYTNWTSNGPNGQFPIASINVGSPASAGTPLTIGLFVLAAPIDKARVGALYTFTVQTNAPAGDTITVTPVTMPAGMTFDGKSTFTWTPSSNQLNTSPALQATATDSQGRTATIGPVSISVGVGLLPAAVPVNSAAGGNVTVSFVGNNVQVYDNVAKTMLSNQTFKSTDTMAIELPAGQANVVVVVLPGSGAAIPREVDVNGVATSTNNQVTVKGRTAADTFTVAGNTVTANGLRVVSSAIQNLSLAGGGGNDNYVLNSSSIPLTISNPSGQGTLDFSHDAAGVTLSLGLDKGQAQYLAGWNTTLALSGVLNEIIGTPYADVLTGGRAATTIIHSGSGNDTIVGGSGDNILVGGGGNDTIRGGANKNLIIGGSGSSNLYASGRSNIVFGGTTNYDGNDQALMNVLNQGPLMMVSYGVRRALAAAHGNPALLSSMLTFQDNGARDTIFGSGSNNWFVAGKYGTVRAH